MGMCNYCTLSSLKRQAKKENKRIVLKQSHFMGGMEVFTVSKGERLPEYKEPSDEYPNGCEVYQKYHKAWMMEIPDHCCC